jgi:phosphate:Na+ symporter
MGTRVLLDLMGGIALLLWGLHMVQSGVLRAYGGELRGLLAQRLSNQGLAFLAGLGLTALLQSSTATALMTAGFVAEGTVALAPAMAAMLGANVGTTLIVQAMAFDVTVAAPVLLMAGLLTFRSFPQSRLKDVGRAAIGLGLMLLALHILLVSLAPAEQAPTLRLLLRAATSEVPLAIALGALLAAAAHSSVAVVLLTMSLAFSNFLPLPAAFALVLGANLGTAITPVFEVGRRIDPASFRLPLGNLFTRTVGLALVAPFLDPLAAWVAPHVPDAARGTALFHLAFNLVLALVFLPLLAPLSRLLTRALPARSLASDPSAPRYLDEAALDTPALALANAARETLRMADLVEAMLRQAMTALTGNNRRAPAELARMDNAIDRLDEAIKLYLTRLSRGALDEREARRAMEIISFTLNLEHVGDILDKNLSELAAKRIKRGLTFPPEGAAELEAFHGRVLESLRLAMAVFISGEVPDAARLLREKAALRDAALHAAERHIERLRDGQREAIDTSSLHLDILRDLKRIHSHICAVAYPVLERAGAMPRGEAAESDPIILGGVRADPAAR